MVVTFISVYTQISLHLWSPASGGTLVQWSEIGVGINTKRVILDLSAVESSKIY